MYIDDIIMDIMLTTTTATIAMHYNSGVVIYCYTVFMYNTMMFNLLWTAYDY